MLKGFIKDIKRFNRGNPTKYLKVYKITKNGKRIPIIERLEFYEG